MKESLQGYHVSLFNTKAHRLLSPGLSLYLQSNQFRGKKKGENCIVMCCNISMQDV